MSILKKMSPQQRFKLIGEISSLMISSKSHEGYKIRDLRDVILPLVDKNYFKIYYNKDGLALGFVCYAKFSDDIGQKYRQGKYKFSAKDIDSGKNVWIVELIAPFNHSKKIIEDVQKNVFSRDVVNILLIDHKAKSLKAVKVIGSEIQLDKKEDGKSKKKDKNKKK